MPESKGVPLSPDEFAGLFYGTIQQPGEAGARWRKLFTQLERDFPNGLNRRELARQVLARDPESVQGYTIALQPWERVPAVEPVPLAPALGAPAERREPPSPRIISIGHGAAVVPREPTKVPLSYADGIVMGMGESGANLVADPLNLGLFAGSVFVPWARLKQVPKLAKIIPAAAKIMRWGFTGALAKDAIEQMGPQEKSAYQQAEKAGDQFAMGQALGRAIADVALITVPSLSRRRAKAGAEAPPAEPTPTAAPPREPPPVPRATPGQPLRTEEMPPAELQREAQERGYFGELGRRMAPAESYAAGEQAAPVSTQPQAGRGRVTEAERPPAAMPPFRLDPRQTLVAGPQFGGGVAPGTYVQFRGRTPEGQPTFEVMGGQGYTRTGRMVTLEPGVTDAQWYSRTIPTAAAPLLRREAPPTPRAAEPALASAPPSAAPAPAAREVPPAPRQARVTETPEQELARLRTQVAAMEPSPAERAAPPEPKPAASVEEPVVSAPKTRAAPRKKPAIAPEAAPRTAPPPEDQAGEPAQPEAQRGYVYGTAPLPKDRPVTKSGGAEAVPGGVGPAVILQVARPAGPYAPKFKDGKRTFQWATLWRNWSGHANETEARKAWEALVGTEKRKGPEPVVRVLARLPSGAYDIKNARVIGQAPPGRVELTPKRKAATPAPAAAAPAEPSVPTGARAKPAEAPAREAPPEPRASGEAARSTADLKARLDELSRQIAREAGHLKWTKLDAVAKEKPSLAGAINEAKTVRAQIQMRDAIEARERVKGDLGELAKGEKGEQRFDLTSDRLKDLVTVGRDYLNRGARTLGEWAERMVADFGELVVPHLNRIWRTMQQLIADEEGSIPWRRQRIERRLAEAELRDTPDQAAMEMERRQGGPAAWISPQGEVVPVPKAGADIQTHAQTALRVMGSPTGPVATKGGSDAVEQLMRLSWARVRGANVEAQTEAFETTGFQEAVAKAAEFARSQGRSWITVEKHPWAGSVTVPLSDLGEFLAHPARYFRAQASGAQLGAGRAEPPGIRPLENPAALSYDQFREMLANPALARAHGSVVRASGMTIASDAQVRRFFKDIREAVLKGEGDVVQDITGDLELLDKAEAAYNKGDLRQATILSESILAAVHRGMQAGQPPSLSLAAPLYDEAAQKAIQKRMPIHIEAVEALGSVPEGYVEQGDLFVFIGAPPRKVVPEPPGVRTVR